MYHHHHHHLPRQCPSAWLIAALVLVAVWGTQHTNAYAQRVTDNTRGSRGKEFRFAFLPNFHGGNDVNSRNLNDSLYIFVTCDKPTNGTISYRNRTGQQFSQSFQIADPMQIFTFALKFQGFEIEGVNNGQQGNPSSQNETPALQSFRVTADEDVTVYGLNQARYSSDAFLALPVRSLGKEYVVMAYNSDGQGLSFNINAPNTSTPSQFAIVATENDTQVRITPSAPTLTNATAGTRTILLNQGEVYLVQADLRIQGGLADLTGSRIKADKPIAVFGSHQRATIPVRQRDQLNSRDHLVEQLPGLETWGKKAFITPYAPPRDEKPIGTDLYRVLAAYDTTKVFLNGVVITTLNAGQYYEAALNAPGWITATDQILVAQFKKTSNTGSNGAIMNNGDPFMMIIPTVEQYDNSYRFINVEVLDPTLSTVVPSAQVFEEHFVTVVIPTRGAAGLLLDEKPVPISAFQPIVNSGFSFANLSVAGGVHTARADSAFGIYVYGYGLANSYGYIGGGKLRIIAPDRDAPLLRGMNNCFSLVGTAYDTLATDSRIASVQLQPTTVANIHLSLDEFTPFVDSVNFRADLVNIYQDGGFTATVRDSIGFITRRTFPVYGFTVGLEGQGANLSAQRRDFSINTGRSRSFPVTLVNYGAATQTISTLSFANNTVGFFVQEQLPIILAPSSRATLNIRFTAMRDGTFVDTLIIGTTCASRSVAIVSIAAGKDTITPTAARVTDECARTVMLNFTDVGLYATGIARLEAETLVNCTVRFDAIMNSDIVRGVVNILDPRKDAIYSLRVQDSSGNILRLRDTVQGLTVRLVNRDTVSAFGGQPITTLPCRTLVYRNIGLQPFVIDHLTPRGNIYFSLPFTQFPITLAPGESRGIQVCFAPLESRDYRDTLLLERFCTADTLVLTGSGVPSIALGTTRCNAEVQITTSSAPRDYFMEQNFPNPTSGLTQITFGMQAQGYTTLRLYNALGTLIANIMEGVIPSGIGTVTLDTSTLESGVYFYELQSNGKRLVKLMYVVR